MSRKSDYALVALAGLARAGPSGASSRQLAERFRLPLPVLRNVLKRLAACGIVVSTRGSAGGYRLRRPPSEVTLAELIEAVEGASPLAQCCPVGGAAEPVACVLERTCPIRDPVRRVNERLHEFFAHVPLSEVIGVAAASADAGPSDAGEKESRRRAAAAAR